jgi:Protein of unknown function (DUF3551)
MRRLTPWFIAAIVLIAGTLPSAAVIIYPWCANYGGKGYGATSCGSTSLKQCLATLAGNGGTCDPNPYYPALSAAADVRAANPPIIAGGRQSTCWRIGF